jgi:dephospho-CoA kinase
MKGDADKKTILEAAPPAGAEGAPVPLSPCNLVTLSASQKAQHKPVIGLIGGIGSGKSQVAALLERKGARVISGDELAHAALRQPEIRQRVAARWGHEILDEHGEVQRRKLGAIVFAAPDERRALEALLHPWIQKEIEKEAADALADPAVRLIVLDAAVMLEAGWHGVCGRLVFVDAPRDVRWRRVSEQRGWTERELEEREHSQLPLTEKAAHADHVVENATTLQNLERQVDDLLHAWGLAPAPGMAAMPHDVRHLQKRK